MPPMNIDWEKIDRSLNTFFKNNVIVLNEDYEREILLDTIIEQLPWLKAEKIKVVVDNTITQMSMPCNRTEFLKCMQTNLEIEFMKREHPVI